MPRFSNGSSCDWSVPIGPLRFVRSDWSVLLRSGRLRGQMGMESAGYTDAFHWFLCEETGRFPPGCVPLPRRVSARYAGKPTRPLATKISTMLY
eukprot:179853-Prorocentrum_minimum.AAC.1